VFYGVVSVFEQVKGRVRQRSAKKIKRRALFVSGPPLLDHFLSRRGYFFFISRVKILFGAFPEHHHTGAGLSRTERCGNERRRGMI
jgi:hypothetical protein